MKALRAMLEHEMKQQLYQMHTANALSILANALVALGGKELEYPMFTDLIGKGKQTNKDTRTAEEIKRDLVEHLLAG